MSTARRKSGPAPEPPAPAKPVDDGIKRPRELVLVGLVISGLWPQLWMAAVALILASFWLTWSGRWERRHSLMVLGALVWAAGSTAILAADKDRVKLGLGWLNPPEWVVSLGANQGLLMLLVQALGIGLFAWAADGMRTLAQLRRR